MKKKIKVYRICGWYETKELPHNFEVGTIWILTIMTFPLWVWFYLIYLVIAEFGKMMDKVKVEEKYEEETYF